MLTQRNLGKLIIDGDVFINGEKIKSKILRRISAYVQQDDIFVGTLTVEEHLHFNVI